MNHQISISIDEVESPPKSPVLDDSPDFFAFSSISDRFSSTLRGHSSRRSSIASSIDSGSRIQHYINQDVFPCVDQDLADFAKEIGANFRKTHQIKEVFMNCPWFTEMPNGQCDVTGNTLLHIAAL